MINVSIVVLKFMLFSLFGYIVEMTMSTIKDHKITNHGFLCGPVIPVYGVGSMFLVLFLNQFKNMPFLVFILGIVITTVIEYITGFLLEKLFHNRWWDYSKEKFNLHGRICLLSSVLFGVGALIIIYIANPIFDEVLLKMDGTVLITLAVVCSILFIIDTIYSFIVAYNLRNQIIIFSELKNEKLAKIPGMLEHMIKMKIKDIKHYPKRLLKAFPYLKEGNEKEFEIVKKLQSSKKKKKKTAKKKRGKKK